MLKMHDPWQVPALNERPKAPWDEDIHGDYVVAILPEKYNEEFHGASGFIYIGGMGTSTNASLRKRVGEFLMDGFGFLHHHSAATYFHESPPEIYALVNTPMQILKAELPQRVAEWQARPTPWDLEIYWYKSGDPLCWEAALMSAYVKTFGQLPMLNRRRNRKGCGVHAAELRAGDIHRGTLLPWE